MSRINLLPWRETLRKERRRRFYSIMGGAAFAMLLVVVAVHLYVSSLIDAQNRRNNFLKSEIAQVEKKIMAIRELEKEKQKLLARMEIIQQLQTQRPEIVHIFDELPRRLPEGIYLTEEESHETLDRIIGAGGTGENKSSLCVDIENRRPTEIDFINAAVVARGARHAMPAPVNRTLVALVKALESRYAEPRA